MTHRSRLTAVLIDVPKADHEQAVAFWTGALGRPGERLDKYPEYHFLGQVTPGIEFMVQATGDDGPRIHIDIESDDVEAEVSRLAKLGATEIDRQNTWDNIPKGIPRILGSQHNLPPRSSRHARP